MRFEFQVTATVGLNIGNIEAQSVKITFWDLGGQGNLQLLWDKYYSECHGIIYVIDSSDIARMDDSRAAFGMHSNLTDFPSNFFLYLISLLTN